MAIHFLGLNSYTVEATFTEPNRRSVALAAENKNDTKHWEGALTTTEVVWHPSGSYGYSLEWVAGSHQARTE
jgi:hypothetical protein